MYIEIGIFFALLIVGLCIGSFLNVVIYRIPITLLNANEKVFNIAWPPS
ncbi:TPA: prepilin peptidase, partial [Escherichia coli]|nr:prepilin peptidase [Escherichia coli]